MIVFFSTGTDVDFIPNQLLMLMLTLMLMLMLMLLRSHKNKSNMFTTKSTR